jgi:hypothetical protein
MNIEEYFNEIQEYVKQNIDDKEQIDNIVHSLEKDNIQAVVNQDFNNGVSIEECGEKVLKQMNLTQLHTEDEPNQIAGERGLNTMERKIMNFKDFVNESKNNKIIYQMTGSPKMDLQFLDPKDRTKSSFAAELADHGYVQGRMNKDCDLLITNDPSASSNKMKMAAKYNIKVVTYAEMIKKYNLFKKGVKKAKFNL